MKFISICCYDFYGFFDVIFVFLSAVVFGWWPARFVGLPLDGPPSTPCTRHGSDLELSLS